MTYVVNCRDIGFDCEGVVKGETEEEVLQKVAQHASSTHGLSEVTDEIVAKVRSVMTVEE